MGKLFKKLFHNKIINNQRGSTLSITIIVVAVLAFSITSITKMTVNLSGSTTAELEAVNDESIGKGLITQSIFEFEQYIVATNSYDDFNNIEISRILNTYNVIVTDETSNFPDFGDSNGNLTKVYKFAYTLLNGATLHKYAYMSNSGSSVDTFHPYEFTLGTEGDLILNGGYYDEIMMFGNNIYLSNVSPWEEDLLTYLPTSYHLTPSSSGIYPVFTDNGDSSEIFYTEDYQYCTSTCYTVTEDGSNPYVINKDNYVDVDGSSYADPGDVQSDNIISFFNAFSFEDFVIEEATNHLPTDNKTITDPMTLATFETVIRNNMDTITYKANGKTVQSYPSTAYVDITNDSNYTYLTSNENLRFGAVYDGDLEIRRNSKMQDWNDEGFIILGDLTINNQDDGTDRDITGTYIITGDLNIIGEGLDLDKVTFIVFGEVLVDHNYGSDFDNGGGYDLSIVAQDNVKIIGRSESYGTTSPSRVGMLVYTEESILIDGVNSKLLVEGGFFARALGNSSNPLFLEDQNGTQINGIVINSYRGYADLSYSFDWGLWDWVKDITYVPSNQDSANRFSIRAVPYSNIQNMFENIPTFEGVTVSDGAYTLETSEFNIN